MVMLYVPLHLIGDIIIRKQDDYENLFVSEEIVVLSLMQSELSMKVV